ncbi:hypothetical protein CEXT_614391 [Caerostris extrusa]|uniref:Uncharacterized protein n=1 Tax=Caerostris extrusa TaxID=172846 RepID=A0AAV4RTJ5_CAEEX|nr:hypothetical protein CEXT_614391 [Caerostris extrusa]
MSSLGNKSNPRDLIKQSYRWTSFPAYPLGFAFGRIGRMRCRSEWIMLSFVMVSLVETGSKALQEVILFNDESNILSLVVDVIVCIQSMHPAFASHIH